jgi:hypothetical protein
MQHMQRVAREVRAQSTVDDINPAGSGKRHSATEELRVVAHLRIHSHGPPDRSHRPSAAISRSQWTHRKPESCMIGAWHASWPLNGPCIQ